MPKPVMGTAHRGITLVEVIATSVIAALLAGGVLNAFLTAIRISQSSTGSVEATYLAQQTLDGLRNHMACDDQWFQPADPECHPTTLPPDGTVDKLPEGSPLIALGGERTYTVTPGEDFDGDGQPDYLVVKATVTWNPPQ